MAETKITLDGMDELVKKLYDISERVGVQAENKALREGAEIVRVDAGRRAPRSELDKPHLADNIIKSNVKTDRRSGIKYIDVGPGKGFFYGLFIEYGTSKIEAKPFLSTAYKENRNEVLKTMADVLRKEIEKRS